MINRYQKRSQNKYNNKSCYYNGRTYHSRKEAAYATELDWRIKAKEIKEVKPQHKIELYVDGIHICNYYVDFRVVMADGSVEYHEVKGFETAEWHIKWKLTQALLPTIENGKIKLVLIK